MFRLIAAITLVLFLVSCGAVRTPVAQPANIAQGVYFDRYYPSPFPNVIILPDGRFYVTAGNPYSNGVTGIAVGTGSTASDARTFSGAYRSWGSLPVASGTFTAGFSQDGNLTATLADNQTFLAIRGLNYAPDVFDFNTPLSLINRSSHFIGAMFASDCGMNIVITGRGSVTGTPNSLAQCTCAFSGTVTPDAQKNFGEATITFSNGCPLAARTLSGVAVLYDYRMPAGSKLPEFVMVVSSSDAATVITGVMDPNNPRYEP
jgi:hypothetical protein